MKRTGSLRRRSKKTSAKYSGPEGRRALVERLLRERPHCEAGHRIAAAYVGMPIELACCMPPTGERYQVFIGPTSANAFHQCTGRSEEIHEIVPRSGGGSILDERNVLALCHSCHALVTTNIYEACALNLRASKHGAAKTAALAAMATWGR